MTKTEWESYLSWFQNADGRNIVLSRWQERVSGVVWEHACKIWCCCLCSKTAQQLHPYFKVLLKSHRLNNVFFWLLEWEMSFKQRHMRRCPLDQAGKRKWSELSLGDNMMFEGTGEHVTRLMLLLRSCRTLLGRNVVQYRQIFHFSREVPKIQMFVWIQLAVQSNFSKHLVAQINLSSV